MGDTTTTKPQAEPTSNFPTKAPFERERLIVELAVQRVRILAEKVLSFVDKGELSKADASPVSLADFGAQALLVSAIHTEFPNDLIIGEENADALRADSKLMKKVWDLVNSTRLADEESEKLLGRPKSMEEMCKMIDLGGQTNDSARGRVWVIDPIDGTKTFLAGTQYAIVVALMVDGVDQLGIIGCPKMDWHAGLVSEDAIATQGLGWTVTGVRGHGNYARPMSTGSLLPATPVSKRPARTTYQDAIFLDSMMSEKSRFPNRNDFAEKLGAKLPAMNIYSSSMTYVALALNIGQFRVRAPLPSAPASFIWDHAGGICIVEEAGCKVTDLRGTAIDLTLGRRLAANWGNVIADESMHDQILTVVKDSFQTFPEFEKALG
ncbi:3',5'-bisphosphate nucleotidase [Microthyrium microscopicum]|uniref:3',5'-bisphosphate nucleotidase n=1 Tax=Microthyrium microscopicum TaxID=703497 RepID=A0A6A6TW45_9PEZI|nr:3',5'-bisphosphate nucleotidase [Microthyrium microscopicum]